MSRQLIYLVSVIHEWKLFAWKANVFLKSSFLSCLFPSFWISTSLSCHNRIKGKSISYLETLCLYEEKWELVSYAIEFLQVQPALIQCFQCKPSVSGQQWKMSCKRMKHNNVDEIKTLRGERWKDNTKLSSSIQEGREGQQCDKPSKNHSLWIHWNLQN